VHGDFFNDFEEFFDPAVDIGFCGVGVYSEDMGGGVFCFEVPDALVGAELSAKLSLLILSPPNLNRITLPIHQIMIPLHFEEIIYPLLYFLLRLRAEPLQQNVVIDILNHRRVDSF